MRLREKDVVSKLVSKFDCVERIEVSPLKVVALVGLNVDCVGGDWRVAEFPYPKSILRLCISVVLRIRSGRTKIFVQVTFRVVLVVSRLKVRSIYEGMTLIYQHLAHNFDLTDDEKC